MVKGLYKDIYNGKKVLVTGHTGFKGSWLTKWLELMGAEVCGYSLDPDTNPSHHQLLNPSFKSVSGDIRDQDKVLEVFESFKPDIVFHLAAQPLVRLSYKDPVGTMDTNILGTLKVYEACRKTSSVKAIVSITTDKVYENKEWHWGYRENDRLGGKDPYSASKAMMEILSSSYRSSFLENNILLATVRAGNVIGGGDWAEDRLLPDLMKNASVSKTTQIRNPNSTRPWQHVLEPLSGYLLVGQKLLEGKSEFADAFNFGPPANENFTVGFVTRESEKIWDKVKTVYEQEEGAPHEAGLLRLDCSKAKMLLGWVPLLGIHESLKMTIAWYRDFYESSKLSTEENINSYIELAKNAKAIWTNV